MAPNTATLEAGDLDVWSFTTCIGEILVLRMDELVESSSLTPWLRLYTPNGILQRSVFNMSNALVNVSATNGGTFIVVAGDRSGSFAGSGAYRLTVNGLSHHLRLCVPSISAATVNLSGVGGAVGARFTVFTSPCRSPAAVVDRAFHRSV